MKWSTISKLDPQVYNPTWPIWENYPQIHEGTRNKLAKGLYVGLFLSENTPKVSNVLVPNVYRQMCPVMKLRDESAITPEEWHYLTELCKPANPKETIEETCKRLAEGGALSEAIMNFQEIFLKSTTRLMRTTAVEVNFSQLYPKQPLSIDDSGSIVMIREFFYHPCSSAR